MTPKELHARKRNIEIAKAYQEFDHRIRTSTWKHSAKDVFLRLEALIQFIPEHTDRQILNRAMISIK